MSRDILINLIDPDPDQPRKHFDPAKLEELAQSIKANGLAVAILLRPAGERFIIVHGERRWRAAQLLKWESIPAEVKDIAADDAQWLALVENVQRSDLSPIEEAQAYQARLGEGMTQEQLGQRIGKTQSYIATKLRLLKLPGPIQQLISQGLLTEGHAKQLLRVKDEYNQKHLAKMAAAYGQSVADIKSAVDDLLRFDELEEVISRGFNDLEKMREKILEVKKILQNEEVYHSWLASQGIDKSTAELLEGLPWLTKDRAAVLMVELATVHLGRVTTKAGAAIEPFSNNAPETLDQCLDQAKTAGYWQNELAAARLWTDYQVGKAIKDDGQNIV